ncbi:hypothetical protein WNY37_02130 [Henriciella sp. AS95]|uniref:hypothetical protein n=1 Tax=Henriciella sp. AS95 TaxID=3135782 RepID=UPI00316B8FFC
MTLREWFAWMLLALLLIATTASSIFGADQQISLRLFFVGYSGSILGLCALLVTAIWWACVRRHSD